MAGYSRAVWHRMALPLLVVACAQAEPLSDGTLPYEPNANVPMGSGGAPGTGLGGAAPATGGAQSVATGGTPAGAAGAPPAQGGATSNGGTPPGSSGGATPSNGGAPPATGGTVSPSTGGSPPVGTGGSAEVERCVALTQDNACTRCVCESPCQAQAFACGASSDTARNAKCNAIVECGMTEHCTSTQCYCGTAMLADCQAAHDGPCIAPIEAAAGTSDFQTIANALTDTTHAINLANAVGECAKQNCAGTCGL